MEKKEAISRFLLFEKLSLGKILANKRMPMANNL